MIAGGHKSTNRCCNLLALMVWRGSLNEYFPAKHYQAGKVVAIIFLLCAGQQGLAAVARACDGRGPKTSLTGAICAFVGVQQAQDLLG